MWRRLGALFLIGAALAACPGPTFIVQQYKGPIRERDTIAILRVNGGDAVRLLALDDDEIGVPIQDDARLHIEMLPGRHRVTVANAKAPTERYDPVHFVAQPNHVYRITFADSAARVYDVDRASDKLLADVTIARPEDPPAALSSPTPAAPPEPSPPPPSPSAEPPADGGAPSEAAADGGA